MFLPTRLPSFSFFFIQSSHSLSISSAVCLALPSGLRFLSFLYTMIGWSATMRSICAEAYPHQ